jgi:tryptophan synthase alpha chain
MGYFNPMLQYGVENFCKKCAEIGIDGLIPDLPVDVYADEYKEIFEIRTNKRTLDYTSNFS